MTRTWHERQLIESTCNGCGHKTNGAGGPDAKPSPGDFAYCIKCGALNIYDDQLSLRAPNEEEIQAAANDPDAQEAARLIREANALLWKDEPMPQPSSQRLADAIAAEPCAPEHEERRQTMVAGALRDHYHDYLGHSATPCVDLNRDCQAIGLDTLAARVRDGEFDATAEEAEAWAKSPDGQATFAQLTGKAAHTVQAALGTVTDEAKALLSDQMDAIAQMIDVMLNGLAARQTGPSKPKPQNGFVLLLAPFMKEGGTTVVIGSNVRCSDIQSMMGEVLWQMEAEAAKEAADAPAQGHG